ncbi:MAG: T9SS type A sorting domain-containing protein [Crocinitomicaceae bacterium]|nr:T9SS type A sorting domain-containing protein [Flavobacteriales bacterium]NQZ34252.1 T9SS type A sorting domain-containing protein [Crocinitomicaceae bacterium]
MKALLSLFLVAFSINSSAQLEPESPEEQCGSNHVMTIQESSVPDYQMHQDHQEQQIRERIVINQSKTVGLDEFVIPVVVHIVYKNSNGNIPYDQVLSQIDALNEAYQGTSNGISTPIRFCLAKSAMGPNDWTDPINEPGVMRYEDTSPNYQYADHVISHQSAADLVSLTHPSSSYFPYENYLNIWVVNSINSPALVQGYAPMPIMPEIGIYGYPLDGIVVVNDVFGDNSNTAYCQCFNLQTSPVNRTLGMVAVHEIGHYLRLYHTFHQGCTGGQQPGTPGTNDCEQFGDFVCDTPPCIQPFNANAYCNSGQVNSCLPPNENQANYPSNINMAAANDGYDMVENYMNYVADPCYQTFSDQQISRMVAFIQNSRYNLTTMENLSATGVVGVFGCVPPQLGASISGPLQTCINYSTTFSAPVGLGYSNTTYSWSITPSTGVLYTGGTSSTDQTININFSNPNVYTIILTVGDGNSYLSDSIEVTVSMCTPIMSSQSNWYFGEYGAIDFSSGIPIAQNTAVINNTISLAHESAVSESDPVTGQLVYYSDGMSVWNGNHVLINPGAPLDGTQSTSQIISVPNPETPGQYYLIIPTLTTLSGPPQFALLDMSGGGSILTTGYLDLPTGISNTSEAVTAIPHCNGIDYWIIFHGDFADRNFYVYRLSSLGFSNSDFTSATPNIYTNNGSPFFLGSDIGHLKSSTSGNHLALTSYDFSAPFGQAGIATYDFNNITGEVSNETLLHLSPHYSCSFAPTNDNILYATDANDRVLQYDLIGGGITELAPQNSAEGMQLAPDGKIYLSKYLSSTLKSIEDPDNLSTPMYNSNAVNMALINSSMKGNGLIDLMDAIKPTPIEANFSIAYQSNCTDIEFETDNCWETYQINWDFGDNMTCSGNLNDPITCSNTTGNFRNPVHTFSTGTYIVTLTITFGTIVTTVSHQVTINTTGSPINGLFNVCTGETIEYSTPYDSLYTYDWTITGGTFPGGSTNASGALISANWLSSGIGTITLTTSNIQVPTCSSTVTEDVLIEVCYAGSLEIEPSEINVLVYPNPSVETLTIELLATTNTFDQTTIQLFDLTGKLIFTHTFTKNKATINTENYSSGIYLLNITSPFGSTNRRVIFQ